MALYVSGHPTRLMLRIQVSLMIDVTKRPLLPAFWRFWKWNASSYLGLVQPNLVSAEASLDLSEATLSLPTLARC